MDLDTCMFLLDAGYHFVCAASTAIEFIIYFNRGFGSAGDTFTLAYCLVVLIFHLLQLRFFKNHINIQNVNAPAD